MAVPAFEVFEGRALERLWAGKRTRAIACRRTPLPDEVPVEVPDRCLHRSYDMAIEMPGIRGHFQALVDVVCGEGLPPVTSERPRLPDDDAADTSRDMSLLVVLTRVSHPRSIRLTVEINEILEALKKCECGGSDEDYGTSDANAAWQDVWRTPLVGVVQAQSFVFGSSVPPTTRLFACAQRFVASDELYLALLEPRSAPDSERRAGDPPDPEFMHRIREEAAAEGEGAALRPASGGGASRSIDFEGID